MKNILKNARPARLPSRWLLILLVAWFGLRVPASAQNYTLNWHTIANGGGTVTAGPYTIRGTIGQADATPTTTNGSYALTGGFWSLDANSSAVALPAGAVAWWPGNSNAVDVIGGNNGTLTNGVCYVAGEVGQAFNPTNNHAGIFIGNPAALQLQNLTIEAWVKRANATSVSDDPSANGGAAGIFYFGSQGYGMGMHMDGAISLTKIDVDDVNDDAYGARVMDTNWHHVAITKFGTNVSFYIDGVAYPSVSYGSTFQFNTPAAIGVRGDNINNNNNDSFAGAIDELTIYNRALTPAEILTIYNAGAAGKYLPAPSPVAVPSGAVAWWPANSNAVDVIGGDNGTLANGVTYVPGEVESAFNFNADSAMVVLSNSPALQLQNFTIETWLQRGSTNAITSDPQAVAGNALFFGYGHLGYSFGLQPNGVLLLTYVDQDDVTSTAAVTDTQWHHLAVTSTNGTVVFYVDGSPSSAVSYARTYQFTTAPAIGGRADKLNTDNNDSFLGSLDELTVYNRALSAAEILSIYEAGAAGKIATAARPLLSITTVGSNLTIAWPKAANYTVQQTTNLLNPASWVASTNVITTNNGTNSITVTPSPVGNLFFRLVQ